MSSSDGAAGRRHVSQSLAVVAANLGSTVVLSRLDPGEIDYYAHFMLHFSSNAANNDCERHEQWSRVILTAVFLFPMSLGSMVGDLASMNLQYPTKRTLHQFSVF